MVAPLVSIAAGSVTVPSAPRPAAAESAAAQAASPAFAALLADESAPVPGTATGGEALPPAGEALPVSVDADPVSRGGGREVTNGEPGSPNEPDGDGVDMFGVTDALAAPATTPVAVGEQSLVNTVGDSHREAVTRPAAGPDESRVSRPLAAPPSPVQQSVAEHPEDEAAWSLRHGDAGVDSAERNHADPKTLPAGATALPNGRPAPGEPPLANAAETQVSSRSLGQAVVDARPQVAQVRPGQVADASEVADIEALMRSVQQAERKPLPDGISRALQAQQQRLTGERSGTVVADKTADAAALPLGDMVGRLHPPAETLAAGPVTRQPAMADQASPVAGSTETLRGMVAVTPTQLSAAPAKPDKGGAVAEIAQAVPDLTSTPGEGADDMLNRSIAQQVAPAQPRGISAAGFGLPQGLVPGTPSWGHAVGERLVLMSAGGVQVAEIQLDPPELGSLHVRLQVQHDQVSLNISSPHAQVREALEQQMPRLREMLAEHGLDLGSSTVADDSGRRGRQADDRPGAAFASGVDAGESADTVAPAAAARPLSLVDHYV
ncbi:MAG: flagellar hook-length control protein FliK [Oceanospirillaceae bacterium]|nr:flagellar hook-length control protein FliK [Oceanospirillaceae bacterium]